MFKERKHFWGKVGPHSTSSRLHPSKDPEPKSPTMLFWGKQMCPVSTNSPALGSPLGRQLNSKAPKRHRLYKGTPIFTPPQIHTEENQNKIIIRIIKMSPHQQTENNTKQRKRKKNIFFFLIFERKRTYFWVSTFTRIMS